MNENPEAAHKSKNVRSQSRDKAPISDIFRKSRQLLIQESDHRYNLLILGGGGAIQNIPKLSIKILTF